MAVDDSELAQFVAALRAALGDPDTTFVALSRADAEVILARLEETAGMKVVEYMR